MKQVLNVGIGGVPFVIEADAYSRLQAYLSHFRSKLITAKTEVMEELEQRLAELFLLELGGRKVISLAMTERVIAQLGMPDGSDEPGFSCPFGSAFGSGNRNSAGGNSNSKRSYIPHKLYRDIDNRFLGGVCAGLAAYFGIDPVLVRVLFILAFVAGGAGLLAYFIFWLITPAAYTPAEKCELRGIPATAENMSKFSTYGK